MGLPVVMQSVSKKIFTMVFQTLLFVRILSYIFTILYNNLPSHIKKWSNNKKKFKKLFLKFLCLHSFYSTEEFFSYKDD
jgi:hypothetical protein